MTKNLGDLFLNGNSITDTSSNHNSIVNTNVTIETVDSKTAMYFDGSSNLVVTAHPDFTLNNDAFTLDTWIKTTGTACIFSNRVAGSFAGCMWFGLYAGKFALYNGTSFWGVDYTSIIDGEWHHVAITHADDTTLSFFIDGVLISANTTLLNLYASNDLNVGYDLYSGVPLTGHLKGTRLLKGEALWTEDFDVNNRLEMYYGDLTPISYIYDTGHRGNLRGKSKAGFVRPTIKQFFTSADYNQTL